MSETIIDNIVNSVVEIAGNKDIWRIRLLLLDCIQLLLKKLNKKIIVKKIIEIVINIVGDCVHKLRYESIKLVKKIYLTNKTELFLLEKIKSKSTELSDNGNYLLRIACLDFMAVSLYSLINL